MTAPKIPINDRAQMIVDALDRYGPLDLTDLLIRSRLTRAQFLPAWQYVKNHYAESLAKVAVWDPGTNTYNLWDYDVEAVRGTLNRINDLCTRLSVFEAGVILALVAQGEIGGRRGRAITMIRDGMADERDELARVLVP